jgi:hypothetical protein
MRQLFLLLLLASLATSASSQTFKPPKSKDSENRWVVVLNERSSDMLRLYAARTTISDWEENILTRPILAGSKMPVNFDDGTGACFFDFRAVFRDNQSVHMWKIDVCTESYWRITD